MTEEKLTERDYEVLDACCELLSIKNEELKAENDRLKAQLNVLEEDNKKLSSENDALYNNSLQEVKEDLVKRVWNLQTGNKELAHYLACMTEQRNRANTCLQEIKEIAEKPKPFKDFSEIKTATEVEYDYATICNELELRLHKVLELITKAESDG